MRKFAICCLTLVAVTMFVPAAQAGIKCHLTNFCDGLQTTTFPTIAGTAVVGLWDFVCLGNNTGTPTCGRTHLVWRSTNLSVQWRNRPGIRRPLCLS
jgi:hypothetical protein